MEFFQSAEDIIDWININIWDFFVMSYISQKLKKVRKITLMTDDGLEATIKWTVVSTRSDS